MAKRGYSFSDRFPHLKLFFFLAVLIAFPLTVWSVQKAPTNTQQEAAVTTCTGKGGACYPSYGNCPSGSETISGTCGTNLDSKCCSKICNGLPYVQLWDMGGYTGYTRVWCAGLISTLAGKYYYVEEKYIGNVLNDHTNSMQMVNWPTDKFYGISFYYKAGFSSIDNKTYLSNKTYASQKIPSFPALHPDLFDDGLSSFKVTSHPY